VPRARGTARVPNRASASRVAKDVAPAEAVRPIVCLSGDDSIFACPDGMRMDANRHLWSGIDKGDAGGAFRGALAPFGTDRMLCADPLHAQKRNAPGTRPGPSPAGPPLARARPLA
jgi:hypothetical protein